MKRTLYTLALLLAVMVVVPVGLWAQSQTWPANFVSVTGLTATDLQTAIDSNEIGGDGVRSAAVCTTETGGTLDELCADSTPGAGTGLWRCTTATCEAAGWERVDDTTGGGVVNTADIGDVSVTQDEFEELETVGATIISAADWTAVAALVGTNTGDNDQVGAVTNTELCQGDGSLVQCDIATLANLNTAIGSGLVTGAHTTTLTTANISDVSVTQDELEELETVGITVISAADWTAVAALVGTNTGDNDQVGAVANTELCQGDGTLVQCNVNSLAALNTAIGSGIVTGAHSSSPNTADIADVSVTQDELEELETIGATVISAADWTAVAALVGVNTGDFTPAADPGVDHSGFAGGDGIIETAGSIAVDLNATLDGIGSTGNLSGLEFTATGELALLQGCENNEIPKWDNINATWDCSADASGSSFFDQSAGVLHPTTATDNLANDAAATNWSITDAGVAQFDGTLDIEGVSTLASVVTATISNTTTVGITAGDGDLVLTATGTDRDVEVIGDLWSVTAGAIVAVGIVADGHSALGADALIDGGGGVDFTVLTVKEVQTQVVDNPIGISNTLIWVPSSDPAPGMAVFDGLLVPVPGAGETINSGSVYSASFQQSSSGNTGTMIDIVHFNVAEPTVGDAGSSVTNLYGLQVLDMSAVAVTGVRQAIRIVSDDTSFGTGSHNFGGVVAIEGLLDIGTVETFSNPDTTPDVSTGIYWITNTTDNTITDFTGTPVDGQLLYVESSDGGTVWDCTSSGLDCGSADITTGAGDLTTWLYTGTQWQLIAFKDQSTDMGTDGGGGTVNTADIADVAVTQDEFEELETIGATVITAADWTAVAALVGVNTGDNDQVGAVANTELCQGDGTLVQCDVATLANLNTAIGSGLVTGAHTADEVGATANTELCQGDGTLVQCDVATLANLNTAIGSGLVTGAHTDATKLPLAGGTMTGALIADEQGVEFTESDDAVTCTTGDYWIRADLSETTLKKCLNGSETVLDTTGGTPSFSDITGATNTSAAMVVGTGASLSVSGSGTIVSTSGVASSGDSPAAFFVTSTELVVLDGSAITCDDATGCIVNTRDNTNFSQRVATFSETDQEDGFWSFELPNNLTGTTISVQYVWESDVLTTTTNDDLCMQVSAVSIATGEAYESASFGTAVGEMDTGGGTDDGDRIVSDAFTVTPTGLGASERLIVRLARDVDATPAGCADDNITGDIDIYALRIEYEVDNVFSGE